MLELNDVVAMAARASRKAIDYLAEVLDVSDFSKDMTPEKMDAYLTGVMATIAYLETYLKLQLPDAMQVGTRAAIDKLSSTIAARLQDKGGSTSTPRKEA